MEMILSKDDQLNIWDFAVKLSKSSMIPTHFREKPQDVFVTVLYGKELGISPIMSLNSFCVIQGQVTMKVNAMNAIVLSKNPKAQIGIVQDEVKKEVVVTVKRNENDLEYKATWNLEKAKLMGLTGKSNWVNQPMNMLRARALSEALRVKFADSLMGLYSEEEMLDLPPIRSEEQPFAITLTKEDLDNDHPIPPEEKEVGPNYRIQNGKFRSKQFKDISPEDLESYYDTLELRANKKTWEIDLMNTIKEYLETL